MPRIPSKPSRGASPEVRLAYAAATSDFATVARLLSRGADASARVVLAVEDGLPDEETTPLCEACKASGADPRIFEALVAAGASASAADGFRETPLHHALDAENFALAERLLDLGAPFDARGWGERTPLMAACGSVEELEWRFAEDPEGFALLESSKLALAKRLVGLGADLHVKTSQRHGPLHSAAYGPFPRICAFLLAAGADPSARAADGSCPLHCAAEAGSFEVCSILAAAFPEALRIKRLGALPSKAAAEYGRKALAKALANWPAHLARQEEAEILASTAEASAPKRSLSV